RRLPQFLRCYLQAARGSGTCLIDPDAVGHRLHSSNLLFRFETTLPDRVTGLQTGGYGEHYRVRRTCVMGRQGPNKGQTPLPVAVVRMAAWGSPLIYFVALRQQ